MTDQVWRSGIRSDGWCLVGGPPWTVERAGVTLPLAYAGTMRVYAMSAADVAIATWDALPGVQAALPIGLAPEDAPGDAGEASVPTSVPPTRAPRRAPAGARKRVDPPPWEILDRWTAIRADGLAIIRPASIEVTGEAGSIEVIEPAWIMRGTCIAPRPSCLGVRVGHHARPGEFSWTVTLDPERDTIASAVKAADAALA